MTTNHSTTNEPTGPALRRARTGRAPRSRLVGLVAGVALVVSGATACSSGSPSKAERNRQATEAAAQVLGLRAAGKTGPAWQRLVPVQQAVLDEPTFTDCVPSRTITDFTAERDDIGDETIRVPGTAQTMDSKRVVMDVSGHADGDVVDEQVAITMIRDGDTWFWALDPAEIVDCPIPEPELDDEP